LHTQNSSISFNPRTGYLAYSHFSHPPFPKWQQATAASLGSKCTNYNPQHKHANT